MDVTSDTVNVFETKITVKSDGEQLSACIAAFIVFQIKQVAYAAWMPLKHRNFKVASESGVKAVQPFH